MNPFEIAQAKRELEKSFIVKREPLCKDKGPRKMAIRSNKGFWKKMNAAIDESEVATFVPSASLIRTAR